MADFPNDVFELREIENLPGIVYDSAKKRALFAEDLQNIANEITAIETWFQNTGYYSDDDVTVTEFFGSALDLGTGGNCRVDMLVQGQLCYIRFEINIGSDPDLGTAPITIKTSDLPFALPTFDTQKAFPGSFGGVTHANNSFQMFAPAVNNISGFGQCVLFFKQSGAIYTDFLLGTQSDTILGAGDHYNGTMVLPLTNIFEE